MSEEQSSAVAATDSGSSQAPQSTATDTGSQSQMVSDPTALATSKTSWVDSLKAGPSGGVQNAADQQKPIEPAQAPKPQLDNDVVEYLKSKGIDASDPSKLDVASVVKSVRSAEQKAADELKQKETIKKLEEVATIKPDAPAPAQAEEPQSPLQEFENIYNWQLNYILHGAGAENIEQLEQINPILAKTIKDEYVVNRQKSWEETQKWEKQQEVVQKQKAEEKRAAEERFKETKTLAAANFQKIREEFPQFDSAYKDSGLSDIFQYLEDVAFWPSSFTLSNPAIAGKVAELAKAHSFYKNKDSYKESIIKEHELSIQKARNGVLPNAGGSGSQPSRGEQQASRGSWVSRL